MTLGQSSIGGAAMSDCGNWIVTSDIRAAGIGEKYLASTAAALGVTEQLAPVRRQQRKVGVVGDGDQYVGVLRIRFAGRQRANQRDARHAGNLAGRLCEGQHAREQV